MSETEPDASEQSIDDEPTVIIPEGAPKPDEFVYELPEWFEGIELGNLLRLELTNDVTILLEVIGISDKIKPSLGGRHIQLRAVAPNEPRRYRITQSTTPDERPSDEVEVEGKVPQSVPNSDKNGGYFPVGYLENVELVAENRHEYDEETDA